MAEVRLERLEKRFGRTEVLKSIDLTIRDGEFFTLVGPSGCGKSTLLLLIAGLESPTEGEIYFDGQPIGNLAPKDRDVAMVFQSYALYPHMTVHENLAFPLKMKKLPPAEIGRRVGTVTELLGLTPVISRKPRELSGGQRQRVALGRAIVRQPRVFLLDEPLSNLDAQLRIETRAELKRLHRRLGVTMLYVTHDQAEAMTLSDRMAVLNEGAIQQCGTPKEIYARPANLFVGQFIGSPPMNLLRGALSPGPPFAIEIGESEWWPLSDDLGRRIHALARSRPVVLGIRPEHLRLSKAKSSCSIEARISLVEPMGAEMWLELSWGEQKIRARASADVVAVPGESVYCEIDETKISLFDADTGILIT